MIKFFRKIRQNLLMENKTGKYFKYAIGEIILVVIGILIALWINNKNQERIKEGNIDTILMAIQDDIVADTYTSQWLLNKYIRDDSLYNKVFNNHYDYDRLNKKELREIYDISFPSPLFFARSNGYAQLKESLNEVPTKYAPILEKLTTLYNINVRIFENRNRRANAIRDNYVDYLAKNEPWRALDAFSGVISSAQIEFYRNNPIFKSHVYKYHNFEAITMYVHSTYREQAMVIYVMINEALGEKARALPEVIRVTSVKTEKDADKWVGTYKITSNQDDSYYGKQLEITSKGKDVYLTYSGQEQPRKLLFYHHVKPWFSMIYSSAILRFENNGENTLSIISGVKTQTHWEKEIK